MQTNDKILCQFDWVIRWKTYLTRVGEKGNKGFKEKSNDLIRRGYLLYVDDIIIEVLQKLPSEGPCIDYKSIPYKRNQDQEFLRDVIAMLNSEHAAGEDKFIIMGVTDSPRELRGIGLEQWRDDNEWQNLTQKISPRPDVRTGYVKYQHKFFGYIYIPRTNTEWVYEANELVASKINERVSERNIIARGQAYTRNGSINEVLMADGRKKLLDKKTQHQSLYRPYVSESPDVKTVFLALALVGGWNEKCCGDIKALEKLSGRKIEDIKRVLRDENVINFSRIKFNNGYWNSSDHLSDLLSERNHIFDDHIDLFFEVIRSCLFDVDPRYDLSTNQQSFSAINMKYNKRSYSDRITIGLSESLAILGNHNKAFSKCSKNKIMKEVQKFERELFSTYDWSFYATISNEMQLLGEACPNVFMDEIIRLLRTKDGAFLKYLSAKDGSILSLKCGYEIGKVLTIIAKKEEYFSKAMSTLMLLSSVRPQFADMIVRIVLPWYPQTHAPSSLRIGVFKGLAQEDNNLTWSILMKLMPYVVTTGSPIQKPKFLRIDDIPEQVTQKDYFDTSIGYIRLAESMIGSDVNRMCDMISVIDTVDASLQQEILDIIRSNSKALDELSKAKLWNRTKDFIHYHRKISDASLILGEERFSELEDFADGLIPDVSRFQSIRLFRYNQYSLLKDKNNYAEEEQRIKQEQTKVLEEIYRNNGLDGLAEFVDSVENKMLAGTRTSTFLNDDEIRHFIRASKNVDQDDFLEGLTTAFPFDKVISIIKDLPDEVKAQILDKIPLTDNLVLYIKELNANAQEVFWSKTNVLGCMNDSYTLLEDTIYFLNQYHRTAKSLILIYIHIFNVKNTPIRPELLIKTLKQNVEHQEENTQNEYYIQQLIKWLQERDIEKTTMLDLEWKYLAFLSESKGYPPINLWHELSENPEFFIRIVKTLSGKEVDPSWSKEYKRNIQNNCFELLHSWKRVPGLDENGKLNKEVLETWFSYVNEKSAEFEIARLSMSYFGQAAFHSPADSDGFFINREVAKYLQSDVDGSILSGYYSEAINSRGIYCVDYSGETEFKIEETYIVRAKAADENGMFRLAATLRDIAAFYHEEGELHMAEGDELQMYK